MGKYFETKFCQVLLKILKKLIFFRGKWSLKEDLEILSFADKNQGKKWAKLSKLMVKRNHHCLKNRFFTLLAAHSDIPIRKIKSQKLYLEKSIIKDTLKNHKKVLSQTLTKIEESEEINIKKEF